MSDWTRDEDIVSLKEKIIEDAFYETRECETRVVLIIDGRRHVFQGIATSYDGDCAVDYEIE